MKMLLKIMHITLLLVAFGHSARPIFSFRKGKKNVFTPEEYQKDRALRLLLRRSDDAYQGLWSSGLDHFRKDLEKLKKLRREIRGEIKTLLKIRDQAESTKRQGEIEQSIKTIQIKILETMMRLKSSFRKKDEEKEANLLDIAAAKFRGKNQFRGKAHINLDPHTATAIARLQNKDVCHFSFKALKKFRNELSIELKHTHEERAKEALRRVKQDDIERNIKEKDIQVELLDERITSLERSINSKEQEEKQAEELAQAAGRVAEVVAQFEEGRTRRSSSENESKKRRSWLSRKE